ncbi:hypothetical protein BO86DRAFT_91703 [Aspergillus japonicus CBS 114.51]|uniref:Secreted protein n=1 Tax=Aspergillus japonicus CBS 114.51 TaxID=1448312 RepID=A0A8T8X0P8_ASPJA|nr:hypothetical protein BO86DRAFT_91703 [Aspergillus japonicus CBS 114.51]RAH81708.1 hypothetical protein BO86DRAFT_91703 [Aspergillus japonicus CBS 114.51]
MRGIPWLCMLLQSLSASSLLLILSLGCSSEAIALGVLQVNCQLYDCTGKITVPLTPSPLLLFSPPPLSSSHRPLPLIGKLHSTSSSDCPVRAIYSRPDRFTFHRFLFIFHHLSFPSYILPLPTCLNLGPSKLLSST